MTDEIRALVSYRLQQAGTCLSSARLLLEANDALGSVNRAYYCAFYYVLALLATKQLGTSKHTGAIAQFHLHFVRTGAFDVETARLVNQLFELRLHGDYRDISPISAADARKSIAWAEQFLAQTSAVTRST